MKVTLDHLTKRFGKTTAVDDFSAELGDEGADFAPGSLRLREIDDPQHALRHRPGDERADPVRRRGRDRHAARKARHRAGFRITRCTRT